MCFCKDVRSQREIHRFHTSKSVWRPWAARVHVGGEKNKSLKPFLSLQFEEYLELLRPEPASVGSEGFKFERKDKCGVRMKDWLTISL